MSPKRANQDKHPQLRQFAAAHHLRVRAFTIAGEEPDVVAGRVICFGVRAAVAELEDIPRLLGVRDTWSAKSGWLKRYDGQKRLCFAILLICAMAMTLLTVLSAAGESLGMDRMLKANTSKERTHSLFRQGCHYYASIPAMRQEELGPLVQRFGEYVLREPTYVHAFGLI